jgi:hypothetical protein
VQQQGKQNNTKSGLSRRDILYVIAIIGFALSLLNSYHDWFPPPQRAELTAFIDHLDLNYVSGNPVLDLTVFVKIVNDSPKTASIVNWQLELNFDKKFQILDQSDSHGATILSPSQQTDFTMSRKIIGENNTALSNTELTTIVVKISYEDDLGMQEKLITQAGH